MTFDPLTNPVHYATIANVRTPGIAEITSANSPRRWNTQKSYGSSGARSKFLGLDIAKITLRILARRPQ